MKNKTFTSIKKGNSPHFVLITGATGFLGSHLVELFVEFGFHVRAFVRRTSKASFLEQNGVEIIYGDMQDYQSLFRAVSDTDVVIHVASAMDGTDKEFQQVTAEGTKTLLAAAEKAGVKRFVHISSIQVLKMQSSTANQPISENGPYEDSPDFLNSYVIAKQKAEQFALETSQRGKMDVVVLRPGILYGPRGKWDISRLGIRLGNWMMVIGNGQYRIPVCFVRNCAMAALLAVQNRKTGCGPFNIVEDDRFTQIEYLRLIKKRAIPALRIISIPYVIARMIPLLGGFFGKFLHVPSPIKHSRIISCYRKLEYSNPKISEY